MADSMRNFGEIELNPERKGQNEDWQKLDSYLALIRYLRKFSEVDREKLKCDMKNLCGELAEQQIIAPMDFEPFGDVIYSETLDRELMFFESAGFIEEQEGSIIYKITDRGIKLSNDDSMLSKGVSPRLLQTLDELIDRLPPDNSSSCQ